MVFHETVSLWGMASNTVRAWAASAQRAYICRRQFETKAVGRNPDTSMRACAARPAARAARPPCAHSWKRWENVELVGAANEGGATINNSTAKMFKLF
jgi:hypothetical protein